MPKKIREGITIYIAPGISGTIRPNGSYYVLDEVNIEQLDPFNINDKIKIYERQVKGWFLNPAAQLLQTDNTGFIVLMICLSYFEGVEQYILGENSHRQSRQFFIAGIKKVFPEFTYSDDQFGELYAEARCGLFHNGMVQGRILIKHTFPTALEFNGTDININPTMMLNRIIAHFNEYLQLLSADVTARGRFGSMFNVT